MNRASCLRLGSPTHIEQAREKRAVADAWNGQSVRTRPGVPEPLAERPPPSRATDTPTAPHDVPDAAADDPAILAEILIEELSIDGMCGVY